MPIFLLLPFILKYLVLGLWSITGIEKAIYHCVAKKRFLDDVARQGGFVEDQRIEDHVHRVGEKIAAAAGQFRLALALDPNFDDARANLARAEERLGEAPVP